MKILFLMIILPILMQPFTAKVYLQLEFRFYLFKLNQKL
jgi:hypothetical protein